jgi:hypothetical protein
MIKNKSHPIIIDHLPTIKQSLKLNQPPNYHNISSPVAKQKSPIKKNLFFQIKKEILAHSKVKSYNPEPSTPMRGEKQTLKNRLILKKYRKIIEKIQVEGDHR